MFLPMKNKFFGLLVAAVAMAFAGSVSAQMIIGTDTGLGGANSITGTVLSPSGQRVEGHVSIRLRTETRGDRICVTDEVGNFAFRGLVNGDYSLVIDKEKDFEPLMQSINVFQMKGAPGQNVLVSIRLKYKAGVAAKPGVVNSELAGVPETALAFYNKAAELGKAGDHAGAVEQLKLAIGDYPKFTLAYNDLGAHYLKMNDLGRADDAFKSALNIDSTSFPPLLNHGLVLFNIKRYAEAETVFRSIVKAKEGEPVGHYFLGQCLAYQDKAKWGEAEKELSTAITLGGEAMGAQMKDAHYILGLIYGDKGDKKRQIAAWETYLKLAPNAPNADLLRGKVKELKGS